MLKDLKYFDRTEWERKTAIDVLDSNRRYRDYLSRDKIYCEFTEDCENYAQAAGYFEATGTLISSERDSVDVTIGGVQIVMQFNPLGEGFTHSGRPALQAGGSLLTKFATTQSTNLNLQVNFNNAIQYALGNGATTPTVHNVIVKDVLGDRYWNKG